jgi:hypothetical protein
MKKFIAIISMFVVITAGLFSGCVQSGEGTLVLKITDAPDYNITEAWVTMSEVRVHYAGVSDSDDNDTFGEWITVVNESQIFDLVALQDVTELFSTADVSAGWYTQIRLLVESALVTIDGVQYNLTIPSKNVKLIKPFKIEDGQTTTLILDFDVQKSVHKTGNDKYIFKPTIKVTQE